MNSIYYKNSLIFSFSFSFPYFYICEGLHWKAEGRWECVGELRKDGEALGRSGEDRELIGEEAGANPIDLTELNMRCRVHPEQNYL